MEKCALKLEKSRCSLFINGACLKENVLPNYPKKMGGYLDRLFYKVVLNTKVKQLS